MIEVKLAVALMNKEGWNSNTIMQNLPQYRNDEPIVRFVGGPFPTRLKVVREQDLTDNFSIYRNVIPEYLSVYGNHPFYSATQFVEFLWRPVSVDAHKAVVVVALYNNRVFSSGEKLIKL